MKPERFPNKRRSKRAIGHGEREATSECNALSEEGIKGQHVPFTGDQLNDVTKRPRRREAAMRLERRIREALAGPAESLTLEQFRAKMQRIAGASEPGWATASEEVIHLTDKDAAFIVSLLENPPPPNRKLKEAFEIYRNSVKNEDSGPSGNVKPSVPIKSAMRTTTRKKSKLPPQKRKPPRCRQVFVILDNRLETVELIGEETHQPPSNDFPDDGPVEFAVVRYKNVLVHVPLDCVVFLAAGIPGLEAVSQLLSAAGRAIESFKVGLTAKRAKRC